ncbi:hypothetical protein HPB47_002471 [Ixodes persulcatus]|uniref:Uncharacterized protein n=1 Tax=Ixodes persulcatus TaxID=34615 RepID=A0AC60PL98_IXOPE|nr:hypothetical protein HPB47_002471 [Ixodes persulcatus]
MKDVSHTASTAQQPDSRRLPESSQVSNFSSLHAAPRQEAQLGLTVGPAAALPAGGGTVEPPRPTPQEHSLPNGHDGITEMTDATEGPSSLRTYTRKRCRLTVDDAADDADTLETGTPSQDEGIINGEGNAADDATMDEHLEDNGWTLPGRRRRPKPPRGSYLPRFDLEKFTVIIQPTGPVDLTKIYDSTIYRQLLEAAGSQVREDLLIFSKNLKANAIVVNIHDRTGMENILKLKELETDEDKIKVSVYRATTGAMPRGVIHGVEPGKTAEDVLQNSHADFHDIASVRPLGNKGTFLLTFRGEGIPRAIKCFGRKKFVHAYRPTAIVCNSCHMLGHKSNICTRQQRCGTCGEINNPEHRCQQQFCVNCRAEDHTAFSRECPAKLKADRRRQQRARVPLRKGPAGATTSNRFELLREEDFPSLATGNHGTTGLPSTSHKTTGTPPSTPDHQ